VAELSPPQLSHLQPPGSPLLHNYRRNPTKARLPYDKILEATNYDDRQVATCAWSVLMSSPATSTTTTSTVIGAPKKGSWLTMAPCRWPEPELSMGERHQALDPLGRYNCWSLCEEGPAHILWKTLSKTIRNLLQEQFEHLDARGSVLHVEIFMVGKKSAKSSPTILFCSENKTLRRRAMELIEKKVISGIHPGVLVAHSSRLPRLLALEDHVPLGNIPDGVYAEGPLKSCGISVYIVARGSAPRRATIGGFVSIRSEYYGLTTAHAFSEPGSAGLKEESQFEFGFSGLGEPEDSSDDEDYLLELTSKGEDVPVFSKRFRLGLT
jgi:hypothetical protein